MITAAVGSQALVHIVAAAAVRVESVSCRAVAFVTSGVVGAVLLAAGAPLAALVHVDAGPEVMVQLVSPVTGADGPTGGVLAVVRTAAVVVLAAVDDLHLDPVALFPISPQLVGGVAHADEGAWRVVAAVSAGVLPRFTFVHVSAGFPVFFQDVALLAVAVGSAPIHPALVHAASIVFCAWIVQYAMLAILGEHVIWLAAAPEMSRRLLHAVMLAAAVADGTRVDGETGAAVHVQP